MASFDVRESVTSGLRAGRLVQLVRRFWWLALLGLTLQAFWALRLDHPTYFDAYYYTSNAQRLADGQGFSEEIIWQYLDNPQGLPHPSHTYWMPLASIIGAGGYLLTGSFRGAQAPFWLMAGLLPLLGYAVNWHLTGERRQAYAAAAFTAVGGYYTAYWVQPTTFVLFAWTGGLCLLALGLAQEKGAPRYWVLAGLTAGLSHLTRADGVLFLALAAALWLLAFARRGPWQKRSRQAWRPSFLNLALLVGGYLVVMAPWFWRTWQISGSILSTVGTQTIFLTEYDDVFAYNRTFTAGDYLAWGLDNIILSKLRALWLAVQTYIAVPGLTAFSFFAVAGWFWARRRERRARFLRPFTWYAVLLLVTMSLVFTFPGQRGSLLHSSTALWPWSMALVPAGVAAAVEWVAARRRRWRPQQAQRLFLVAFVLMAFVITLVVASGQPLAEKEAALYEQIGATVPPGSIVMTGDPTGFHYHSGLPAVVTPNEPPEVMVQAAQHFGVDYVLLDENRPAPLKALYEGQVQSEWLSFVQDFGDGYHLYAFVEPHQ
ncbi:MAG TPA: glycosyltransferase family 39 protein [Candidatus Sulfomarinibacteraceae bacterium]|nr:glycosyltransferase family 39 protein [Candidatus Sulfomarinibacteraceae bacterium]